MQTTIRNFAIIAHIDHGKSTLADRLLELTGTVAKRDMQAQILDSNPIERERGITIKLAPVRMEYYSGFDHVSHITSSGGEKRQVTGDTSEGKAKYILNLIDTPGHVDFSYEVSRSLAACEGALLVVDATQGVQAQTLANLHQARSHKLTIIPIINKIDLPNAKIEETTGELEGLGFERDQMIKISAKTGENVEKVLEAIVERIPPPHGNPEAPLRALVFSSQYDAHKGVVVFVRVVDGAIRYDSTLKLQFMVSGAEVAPIEVGYFIPQMVHAPGLLNGEVGYIATGLKDIRFAKVGDTITATGDKRDVTSRVKNSSDISLIPYYLSPLSGYKEPKPMVFLGLFPINSDELTQAREAMERLRLSDSAFSFRPISSLALGNGFHCGFLGLLHAEIVQERLNREFGLSMIATTPSVEYILRLHKGVIPAKAGIISRRIPDQARLDEAPAKRARLDEAPAKRARLDEAPAKQVGDDKAVTIQSATEYPDPSLIEEVREPIMNVTIFSPKRYVGAIMQLSQEKRAEYVDLKYVADQAEFTYLMPLSEMIIDFFDRLKSITEGYASLDYEFYDHQKVEVVKLDILVNKEKVDALSFLVVVDQAERRGREIVERLSRVIPRAQFQIPIQAAIGGQVIARSDVKAFRKDVIQKLYGGDRTRKDKLLEAQKKGKARLKLVGKVAIPQSAFFEVLKHG